MFSKITKRLSYANVVATIALFAVLGGGMAVAGGLKKSSVKSKTVKDNSVKSQDLKDGVAVSGADVVDNSLKGADIDESSLEIDQQSLPSSLPPSGPAGGSLAGEFPNPSLAQGSVAGAELADGAVGAAEIQDGSLSAADVAKLTGSFSLNPANIPAGDCTIETPDLPGVGSSDIVTIRAPFNHTEGDDEFSITVGSGTAVDPVRIKFCNPSAADENPNGGTYTYMAFRP